LANKNVEMLIPNVTRVPGQKKVDHSNRLPKQGGKSEFNEILKQHSVESNQPLHGGLNVSSHAAQRLQERSIDFNGDEYMKVKDAMAKLKAKGGKQSLVVTDKAAYIVDVKNNKLVTAVDKASMNENVFTKIDSTLFVN
jgi:flagellar operon protein